jgi:hypothetical protein
MSPCISQALTPTPTNKSRAGRRRAPLFPSINLPKIPRQHHRHHQPSHSQRHHAPNVSNQKIPHTKHQQIPNHQIERSPQNIYYRRGLSLPRRRCKWRRKFPPHHSGNKMRHGVHQKHSPKKVCRINIPSHFSPPSPESRCNAIHPKIPRCGIEGHPHPATRQYRRNNNTRDAPIIIRNPKRISKVCKIEQPPVVPPSNIAAS